MVTVGHRLGALALILSVVVCLRLAEVLLLRGDAATLPAPGGLGKLEHFAIIRVDPLYGRGWYTGQYHCMVLVTIAVPVVLSIVVFRLIAILMESRERSAATASTGHYVKLTSILSGTLKPRNARKPSRPLHS